MISTSKSLKVGGPILTGIGGVIATSSLVSRSAEEKTEERIKTKALKDEDPAIKEYKDANESNQQGDSQGDGESSSSQKSDSKGTGEGSEEETGNGENEGSKGSETSDSSTESNTEGEKDGDSSVDSTTSTTEDGGDVSSDTSNEMSSSSGVTSDGASDAENSHASGTKYGVKDMRMTKQELEKTMHMKSGLESYLEQLKNISI
ncbi:hypothetical protein MHC_03105 [Mycoplasma haemocanis str. Illinois]|uniref:Uncharacterized protein n=1 Tax=Mycoplasma haemocanis (strain Illinois) TaxID=1111676 RepID=H6N759_MYCHN|nr:hypothetical protein [Mycoplasma haemocanis]AEW45481.1 hypothetical protein MHC_03105 [Mycoplasma haemocanis str. Illinois]